LQNLRLDAYFVPFMAFSKCRSVFGGIRGASAVCRTLSEYGVPVFMLFVSIWACS
jgi:hypothetical protein